MDFPLTIAWSPYGRDVVIRDRAERSCYSVGFDPGFLRWFLYADEGKAKPLYKVEYDNFGPQHRLGTPAGEQIGSVNRTPWRSVWRAHYVIRSGETPAFTVTEERPFTKVLDFFAGTTRWLAPFTGLFLNPTYRVERASGEPLLRIIKDRSLFENVFTVEAVGPAAHDPLQPDERDFVMLAILAVVMKEANRG